MDSQIRLGVILSVISALCWNGSEIRFFPQIFEECFFLKVLGICQNWKYFSILAKISKLTDSLFLIIFPKFLLRGLESLFQCRLIYKVFGRIITSQSIEKRFQNPQKFIRFFLNFQKFHFWSNFENFTNRSILLKNLLLFKNFKELRVAL